jgi:hypothetical protein
VARGDDVLFYAIRARVYAMRATAMSLFLTSPIILFSPEAWLVSALLLGLMHMVGGDGFRLELTATHLRIKAASFLPAFSLALDEVADARALVETPADRAGGIETGTLVVTLASGRNLAVPGLVDPSEAARATLAIKRDGVNARP